MNVAFVSQPLDGRYPPPGNSVSTLTYEFARHLPQAWDVTVMTSTDGRRAAHTIDQGVSYRHFPLTLDRLAERITRRLKGKDPRRPYYASVLSSPAFAWRVAQEARRHGTDIVHIHNNPHFIPIVKRFNRHAKIVLHMHCEWLNQLDGSLLEPQLAETDLIIGVSDYITNKVKRRFPSLSERCRTLYNGVDVDRFLPATTSAGNGRGNDKNIVFVGRISPEKGVHVLLEGFARVARKIPDARLKLVGSIGSVPPEYVMDVSDDPLTRDLSIYVESDRPGTYAAHLRELVSEFGLDDKVEFEGMVPNGDLPGRLASCDLFVFPSVWEEPFGIPPVEAMAVGVPVVATRSGGVAETVVDGDTGLLVERGDPAALGQAMIAVLENEQMRTAMGSRGRERAVKKFSYPVVAGELMDLYREIC